MRKGCSCRHSKNSKADPGDHLTTGARMSDHSVVKSAEAGHIRWIMFHGVTLRYNSMGFAYGNRGPRELWRDYRMKGGRESRKVITFDSGSFQMTSAECFLCCSGAVKLQCVSSNSGARYW